MQEWLDNNDISMYSTHNEGKSVIAERFMKTLNKLVDQYNNTYHHSINEKPINADYSVLTEKLRPILNLLNLNLMIESELLNIRIFLVKVTLKIGQEKYLLSILL